MGVVATHACRGMARLGGNILVAFAGEDLWVESEGRFKVRLELRGGLACQGAASLSKRRDDSIEAHADRRVRTEEKALALHRFERCLRQIPLCFRTFERYLRLCSHASPCVKLKIPWNFELT